MAAVPALRPLPTQTAQPAPQGGGVSVQFVPHAAPIMAIGLMLATVALLAWMELRKCTCQDKPTILKPRWRKYDGKDRDE